MPDGTNGTTAWYKQQGVYVDLNQPLSVGGVNQYPILDGDAGANDLVSMTYGNTLPSIVTPATTGGTKINVLGPLLTGGQPQVAGFWVNSNVNALQDPASPNKIPMPVKMALCPAQRRDR
ncbi:MAG: hypothetical protein WDO13_15845, partial [Verrucomicrobiota bacterium]